MNITNFYINSLNQFNPEIQFIFESAVCLIFIGSIASLN